LQNLSQVPWTDLGCSTRCPDVFNQFGFDFFHNFCVVPQMGIFPAVQSIPENLWLHCRLVLLK